MSGTGLIQSAASGDLAELTANITILIAFVGTAVVGIKKGIQQFRSSFGGSNTSVASSGTMEERKVLAASIMETATLGEWSRTNLEVKSAIFDLKAAIQDNTEEMRELRHCIQLDMATRGHRR